MQHVISFSGGRTSAYMTLEVLERHPDAKVIFMDTGAEHPKTYEFVRNFAREFDIKITCLRVVPNPEMRKASTYEVLSLDEIGPDLEPWKRMLNKYGHPYVNGAFCTDRMKTVPFTKYCQENFGKGSYHTWLGIRIDEPLRLKVRSGFSYLAEISDFEKQDILDWWAQQDFDLGIQEHLGNCVFCIKKSLQKVALATKDEPELARDFSETIHEILFKRGAKTLRKQDKRQYGNPSKMKSELKITQPQMYRSKAFLPGIIAMFSDTSRDDLASRMTSMRQYETGSCSESCEAFSDQHEEVSIVNHSDGSATMEFMDRDFFAKLSNGYFTIVEVRSYGFLPVGKFFTIDECKEKVMSICR